MSIAAAATQLRQLIYYHLDNDLLENANFLAGRLHALLPRSEDSVHLLALTYLRLRRFRTAFDYAQKYGATGKHLGCAYVFAQACLELGRNTEGIAALEKSRAQWSERSDWNKHSETSRRHLPDAPAALTVLGKLWRAHGDMKKAADCYVEVHKANPFIWEAFEGLCKLRADLKVENMFRMAAPPPPPPSVQPDPEDIFVDHDTRQPLALQPNYGSSHSVPPGRANLFSLAPKAHSGFDDEDVFASTTKAQSLFSVDSAPSHSEWDTPVAAAIEDISMGGGATENDDVFGEPPAAPPRKVRGGSHFEASDRPRQPALRGHMHSASEGTQDAASRLRAAAGGQKRTLSGQAAQICQDPASQPRRSNRLGTQHAAPRTTRSTVESTASTAGRPDRIERTAKAATGARNRGIGRVVSGNRKIMPLEEREKEKRAPSRASEKSNGLGVVSAVLQKPATQLHREVSAEQTALNSLLDDFRQLAIGYHAASQFDLTQASKTFKALPNAQKETPWVLSQLAKAHYESGDYKTSEDYFARLVKIQPSRIEDMEIYSTVLWHLKKESALTFLCQVLRDQDFDAPQTWVAVGNAFSLAREHDQAISAFKRATQLDPSFAYAHTLMGHEYIANEAFDSALAAFRTAVAADRLGYAGWYGLGKSYERLGKLEDAERHYRIATTLNPANATLLVCVGVVLERLRNRRGALANYAKALELAPHSALARFKKARVLMHLKHYPAALLDLEILKTQASDEANVWFLLGKCYKGMGDRSAALRALTTALNLDVKVC